MRLVTALLVRNEAGDDRFLRRVLTRCLAFSDTVVVLDDNSSDDTAHVASSEFGAIVHQRDPLTMPAWGREASARKELWELACRVAGPDRDAWVLICDADQELIGDVRALCRSRAANTWCIPLYDCWSAVEYREDEFWQAHLNPRPWLYAVNRVPSGWTPDWGSRGIHVGHAPANWPMDAAVAPESVHWLHWGYSNPVLREKKLAQYRTTWDLLTPAERKHAESIIQ